MLSRRARRRPRCPRPAPWRPPARGRSRRRRTIGPSSAEEPKRGVATPSRTVACTTSSRPAALGTSRASVARTAAAGGGAVMPATVRTSGTPTRRKTTSAERGFPGSPISGTPPQSASSVGLPGLIASPWQTISPSRPATVAVRSRAPTEEPAETTTTSSSAMLSPRARSSSAASSGTIPRSTGSPPASRTSPARAGAQASRTWPGASVRVLGGTISSPVEMIPTRGRACASSSVTPAAASRPRSAARSGRPAGARIVAGRGLLAGLQHAVAGSDAAHQLDVPGHRLGGVLDHHDGVGSGREQPAGRDRHRRARADLAVGRAAHRDRAGELEERRQRLGGRVGVGRPHGVAVDGRARPAGQPLAGTHVDRGHDARAPGPPRTIALRRRRARAR